MENNNMSKTMVILKGMAEDNKKLTQAVDNNNDATLMLVSEMMNITNRAEKAEKIATLAAGLSLEILDEIRKHECLSNAQCQLMSIAVKDKTTEITKTIFDYLEGKEFVKMWGYVNRGIWTIYKNNVNDGSKAPYSTTLKIRFDSAIKYIQSLSVGDYLNHRSGNHNLIKKFVCVLPIEQKAKTIHEMINDRLDKEIEKIDIEIENGNDGNIH